MFTPSSLQGTSEDQLHRLDDVKCKEHVWMRFQGCLSDRKKALGDAEEDTFVCFNRNIPNRIQSGPSCGLMALRMGAEYLLNQYELREKSLLDMAIEEEMSNKGEMFNAYHLATLANSYYEDKIKTFVWDKPWNHEFLKEMIHTTLKGSIWVIPYDTDKNHAPCMKRGEKAHWCIVKGLIIGKEREEKEIDKKDREDENRYSNMKEMKEYTDKYIMEEPLYDDFSKKNPPIKPPFEPMHSIPPFKTCDDGQLFYYIDLNDAKTLTTMDSIDRFLLRLPSMNIQEERVWVITQQGKSKLQGVWSYKSLKESNANLYEYEKEKMDKGMKVPSKLENLREKAIRIYKEDEIEREG